jgi:hypothetical protein
MGLTTALDLATLQSWSLITDYTGNQPALIEVAKSVYQALRTFNPGAPINPIDLERPLGAALQVNAVFKGLCAAKRHAWPALHPSFASAMARYLIDYEWHRVTGP